MAIVENKLKWIITISVILFCSYTISAFIPDDFNPTYTTDDINYTQEENYTDVVDEGGTSGDVWGTLGSITGAIFLQIPNAPPIINGALGFIAGTLIFTLIFVIIAYIRELIGFT